MGLIDMASILDEAAATVWERWRLGLWCTVERIQSRVDLALTCKVLSTLLVGLENRRPYVLESVTSALCRIWVVVEGGMQICLQYSHARTIWPCGSADMDWTLPPRAPSGLEDESSILYKWAREQPLGNVIALLGFYLSSGCVLCRGLLALVERRESQTRFGIDFYSADTSSASWVGRSGWLKGIRRGLATLSTSCSGQNSTRTAIQSQMGRLQELARAAARHRRAQFHPNVLPPGQEMMNQELPEDTSHLAAPTVHPVTVMGECAPIANQEESFPHGLLGMSKRGRLRSSGSRLASREILSEIATNLPSIVLQNGNAQDSTHPRTEVRASHARGGRLNVRGRGSRGRRAGMARDPTSRGHIQNGRLRMIAGGPEVAALVGWTAPHIRTTRQSPIQLRPRVGNVDTCGQNSDKDGDVVDLTTTGAPWGSYSNSDAEVGFTTPPRH